MTDDGLGFDDNRPTLWATTESDTWVFDPTPKLESTLLELRFTEFEQLLGERDVLVSSERRAKKVKSDVIHSLANEARNAALECADAETIHSNDITRLWHHLTDGVDVLEACGQDAGQEHVDEITRLFLCFLTMANDFATATNSSVWPTLDGQFRFSLRRKTRKHLLDAVDQLREMLSDGDPATYRLFPDAYPDDGEKNEGWHALVRDRLTSRKLEQLELLTSATQNGLVSHNELVGILQAAQAIHISLQTRLEDEPSAVGGLLSPRQAIRLEILTHASREFEYHCLLALETALDHDR